tara:strand:- start:5333 stop:6226 length:894 start_codon:yes stop_codon:yes gene_type:complete
MISLVTGAAGFIGSHMVDGLLNLGHEVVAIDNEYADNDQFYWNDKAMNVRGDITDYKFMKNAFTNVDYVFHCAAESRIGTATENPINAVDINVKGTCTLLQVARETGVKKFLYSSTSSGYGNNPFPNVETQPDDCLNPYSVSKIAGEKLCEMYTNLFGLQTIIFRYFNVYGERAPKRGQYAPVIGIFERQRDAGESLTIVGDGEQRRDFVHVKDVVNANIMAAISNPDDEAYGQIYNVGTGINYSVNEIADLISDNQVNIPSRKGEARITLANIDKIYKTFKWKPQIKLDDWIKETL